MSNVPTCNRLPLGKQSSWLQQSVSLATIPLATIVCPWQQSHGLQQCLLGNHWQSGSAYLSVVVGIKLCWFDDFVFKVYSGGGDGIGQYQQQDQDVEPSSLQYALKKWRRQAAWLVFVDGHHLPALRVTVQDLAAKQSDCTRPGSKTEWLYKTWQQNRVTVQDLAAKQAWCISTKTFTVWTNINFTKLLKDNHSDILDFASITPK